MNKQRVTYTPRPDATPETEIQVLAEVYRFVLDCHKSKTAAESTGGQDDANGGLDGCADENKYTGS